MKKYLVLTLTLMLTFAWVWAAGEDANNAVSSEQEAKWQPEYGPKGDLLNPAPGVTLARNSSGETPELPIIATTLVSQDFEEAWTCDAPPTGWTIIDNGSDGSQSWWQDDWYNYYYSTFGDTTARIYYIYSLEDNYDEWLISPSLIISGTATSCSLSWQNYYNDDGAGKDTAYIKITTDGGSNWTDLLVWDEDHYTSPYYEYLDLTSYVGQTIQIAFNLVCNTGNYGDVYDWKVDEFNVWTNEGVVIFEEFDNWGPYGDNPPTGWTIVDNGTPSPASGVCDANDWEKSTSYWSSGSAMAYYTSSNREVQDEWMISPTFAITGGADACTLSFAQYFYVSTTYGDQHGYVLLSTDGGSTWPIQLEHLETSTGSSSTKEIFSYDLTAYAGMSNLKVAFNFQNIPYGFDRWVIDDVIVEEYTLLAHDVSTSAINSPTLGIEGFDANISVDVSNLGLNTETFTDSAKIWQLNSNTLFYENFSNPQGWDGASPPTNVAGTWAVIDSGDEASPVWNNNDWHGYYYSTWSDTIARVYYSPIENQNEWLITPSLDLSTVTEAHLTFKQFYNDISTTGDDTAWVLGTNDNWVTTQTIAMYNADQGTSSSPDYPDYDITSWAAGQAAVKIAFKYVGNDDWYWYLDDVEVYEVLTPTLVYSSEETVTALTSLEVRTVDYASAFSSPSAGDYILETFTNLATDEDNSNDSMMSMFTVYPHIDSFGPDAGYYHWVDNAGNGPAFNWYDISGTGTPVVWDMGSGDDRRTSSIPMGISFLFYGTSFSSIFLNENGVASFDSMTLSHLTNNPIPSTSNNENLIAWLWDDLDGTASGMAYYQTVDYDADTDMEFIVQFDNWEYYSSSLTSTIQAQFILDPTDNSVVMQYNQHGPDVSTSHTVGIEDGTGTIGLEYIYNGNPFGNTPVAGLAITYRYVPPAIDISVNSFTDTPTSGLVGVGVDPNVEFSNLGSDPANNVPVRLTITPGIYDDPQTITSLPAGAFDTVSFSTFTPTTAGAYLMTAENELADGDDANDTLSMQYFAFDAIWDFEASDGGLMADGDWEWGIPSVVGPDSAHSPTHCWGTVIDGDRTSGSPNFFWSNLRFDLDVGTGNDAYFYFYSWRESSGNTFDSVNTRVNDALVYSWYGDAEYWDIVELDLTSYTGIVEVNLQYGSRSSIANAGWYVDDFSFINCEVFVADHDVIVTEFVSPTGAGEVGVPVTPEVVFTNGGLLDETNVPVYLYIDPGGYADTQTIATLDSGTFVSQQFAQFTPTSGGAYMLTAVSDLAGDQDPSSDTLMTQFFVFDTIIDFEADNGDLASGGDGDWEWGMPTSGPGSAYSGVNLWATVLAGNYTSGLHTLSFQLDLGATGPSVGVASWYDTEASWDGGNFAVSTDGGMTWDVVSPDVGYTGVANASNPIPTGDSIFTGHVQGFWEFINFDLSAYAGTVVDARFAFGADGSVFYPGWYIDDLSLADCAIVTPDIDVTPLAVAGQADPGFADADTITVSNTGDGTVNFTATAVMDEAFTDFNGNVLPLSNITHPDIRRRSSDIAVLPDLRQDGAELERAKAENPDNYLDSYMPEYKPEYPLPIIAVDIAYENFDDGLLPAGWSVVDGGNTIETWDLHSTFASGCQISYPELTTDWMMASSDCKAVSSDTLDEMLYTDFYDCSSYSLLRLAYNHNFQKFASYGDTGIVEVRNGQGGAWTQLALYDFDGGAYEDFDIFPYVGGGDSVQIRFHYMDRGDPCWQWAIDDFLLYEPDTPWLSVSPTSGSIAPLGSPIELEVTFDAEDVGPGIYTGRIEIASNDPDEAQIDVSATFIVGGLGTIAGQVTDANTAGSLEGAIVTANWASATTVVDTTDEGGLYSIDITPGTVNVTVEFPGYQTDSQDVSVVENQTTTHNVALGAPVATIDTSPVIDTVTAGDTAVYSRYLYNTGTAPLTYNVSLDFSGGGLGLNVQNNSTSEMIMNVIDPTGSADLAPFIFNNGNLPVITDFMDSIYVFWPESTTADNGCLGLEFDGTYFWVTGRNASGGDVHKLHKFDSNGNLIMSYDQGTTSTWGWRDLAWDGQYLYASDENEFAVIDPATGSKISTLPKPSGLTVVRAVAYDPATDHFWAANFSSDIYEFDRTGTIINQYANTKSAYGMAWDDLSEGGPFLWVNSQDGTPQMQISQFDPGTGTYTGVSWQSALPGATTAALAGGACFTTEWDAAIGALFVLGQGTPTDFVYGYEIATNITWLTVQSGGSGQVAVDDSALIEFLVDFTDSTIVVDSTYEGDANINNNSIAPTPVIHFAITAGAGGCDYVVGDVNGSDNYNGLDITYGVAFFKGGAVPQCVDCPLCPGWWYCGDVNASCNYNGLDITYGVAYFKGGPGPMPCADCPPIGGPASIIGNELKPAVQGNEFKPVTQPTTETKSKKGNSLKR